MSSRFTIARPDEPSSEAPAAKELPETLVEGLRFIDGRSPRARFQNSWGLVVAGDGVATQAWMRHQLPGVASPAASRLCDGGRQGDRGQAHLANRGRHILAVEVEAPALTRSADSAFGELGGPTPSPAGHDGSAPVRSFIGRPPTAPIRGASAWQRRVEAPGTQLLRAPSQVEFLGRRNEPRDWCRSMIPRT